jgi:hypothetical protein
MSIHTERLSQVPLTRVHKVELESSVLHIQVPEETLHLIDISHTKNRTRVVKNRFFGLMMLQEYIPLFYFGLKKSLSHISFL